MSENKNSKKEQFLIEAKADPDFKHLPVKQRIQLFTLKRTFGNVSKAAQMLGISRFTFYHHCNNHPEYKEAFDQIKDVVQDFVDDVLFDVLKSSDDDNARLKAVEHYNRVYSNKYSNLSNTVNVDHTTKGEKIEAPQQMFFLSADKMTAEEIEKYKAQYLHQPNADSNNEST